MFQILDKYNIKFEEAPTFNKRRVGAYSRGALIKYFSQKGGAYSREALISSHPQQFDFFLLYHYNDYLLSLSL